MSKENSLKKHDSVKLWRSLDGIISRYRKKNNLARLDPNRYYLGVARLLSQITALGSSEYDDETWAYAQILYDAFLTSKFNKSSISPTKEIYEIDEFLSSQCEDSND